MTLLLRASVLHRTSLPRLRGISIIKHNFNTLNCIRNKIELPSNTRINQFYTNPVLSKASESQTNTELIYQGALKSRMLRVKIFSFTTSAAGLLVQPMLIKSAAENNDMLGILGVSLIFLLFTIVNPVAIHLLVKRYVTEMYYNKEKDEYNAITYSFFLRRKEMKFQASDAKPLELTGMFTNCTVKGVPLYLDRQNFEDPMHYDKIMGFEYDKIFPIDEKDYEKDFERDYGNGDEPTVTKVVHNSTDKLTKSSSDNRIVK